MFFLQAELARSSNASRPSVVATSRPTTAGDAGRPTNFRMLTGSAAAGARPSMPASQPSPSVPASPRLQSKGMLPTLPASMPWPCFGDLQPSAWPSCTARPAGLARSSLSPRQSVVPHTTSLPRTQPSAWSNHAEDRNAQTPERHSTARGHQSVASQSTKQSLAGGAPRKSTAGLGSTNNGADVPRRERPTSSDPQEDFWEDMFAAVREL